MDNRHRYTHKCIYLFSQVDVDNLHHGSIFVSNTQREELFINKSEINQCCLKKNNKKFAKNTQIMVQCDLCYELFTYWNKNTYVHPSDLKLNDA